MFDQYQEHLDSQPDSIADIDRDEATWDGYKYPDKAWLLSPRDVWYPNPHYTGEPQPHPEDEVPEEGCEEVYASEEYKDAGNTPREYAYRYDFTEDIPF